VVERVRHAGRVAQALMVRPPVRTLEVRRQGPLSAPTCSGCVEVTSEPSQLAAVDPRCVELGWLCQVGTSRDGEPTVVG
jgi:hypothetical protein